MKERGNEGHRSGGEDERERGNEGSRERRIDRKREGMGEV